MRKISVKSAVTALLAVAAVGTAVVMAYEPYGYIPADRGQASGVSGAEAKILPTAYLREYDPVTVFFDKDAVPGDAGPIDAPGQLLSITPSHPGEFVKIDGRTLEFRPSAPWEPLKRYKAVSRKITRELFTLLPDPEAVFCGQVGGGDDVPIGKTGGKKKSSSSDDEESGESGGYYDSDDDGEGYGYRRYRGDDEDEGGWKPKENLASSRFLSGAEPVKSVGFVFSAKVDVGSLSRLISVETCPLPGVDSRGCRTLRHSEYKVREDILGAKSIAYRVLFNEPIGYGQRIKVTLKFADKAEFKGAQETYIVETKPEFTLERVNANGQPFTLNAGGVSYDARQAIKLDVDRELVLVFSAPPSDPGISVMRSMVSVSPAPSEFKYSISDNRITVNLGVEQEKLYKVVLNPSTIKDKAGRALTNKKPSSFYVYLPKVKPNAKWDHGFGIVERLGPQHFPITASGLSSLDFRVYKIDPLHTAFGDFPSSQIEVSETSIPPGPGEEPSSMDSKYGESNYWNYPSFVQKHIRMLGSPHYSGIVNLDKGGMGKISGVDLKPMFAAANGKDKAGTYLVGFRLLDGAQKRYYAKITVTDLCLSAVESKRKNNKVMFAVTSYSSEKPVADASIRIDGLINDEMVTLAKGKTGADGFLSFEHTSATLEKLNNSTVRRVVVSKGDDVLVINTENDRSGTLNIFSDNHWSKSDEGWLNWPGRNTEFETEKPTVRGFVRTERPIYRPEDSVFIKGYIRELLYGAINLPAGGEYTVKVSNPSSVYFTRKVALNEFGAFHLKVAPPSDETAPTGTYTVSLYKSVKNGGEQFITQTDFLVDAYRIPRFEVKVSGADRVPNDRPALVRATATYYAGGRLVERDVAWKVTSYPYDHRPRGFANYILSSDTRYGASREPVRQSVLEENGKTDGNGNATVTLNPQAATAGNPTKYVVEATVTDADMQTVSGRHTVIALPPFILGIHANRHITSGSTISARIAAIGVNDSLVAGQKVSVELKRVSWTSYLTDSDFSSGKPKYITNESADLVEEREVVTSANPTAVEFKNQKPGVYILALSSRDRLGRLQTVKIDLYLAGGEQQQAWKKAEQSVFETVMDRNSYEPGQQAKILLKSPYKKALALAVTEMPNGENSYKWVNVDNGQGTFTLDIKQEMAPRVPVSFLLMRPRTAAPQRTADGTSVDAGKPETVGNTTWLTVNPVANMLDVKLSHVPTVTPGATFEVTINLRDIQGKPRPGEVALWLVDEAVLSLRKEHSLDPLEAFLKEVDTHLSIMDSRNLVIGDLLASENPGGDGGEEEDDGLGKVTPRKNFKVVPYWNPSIKVDKNGIAVVKIKMSDDLTNFAIRAMAVSGPDRFGAAKSRISVRLPITIQPALPRFVRLGDKLRAGGIARVVEGGGGAATFMITAKGLSVKNIPEKQIQLDSARPMQLYADLAVETPPFTRRGKLQWDSVSIKMAVKRNTDNAGDAFEVKIPLLLDRQFVEETQFAQINKGGNFSWQALPVPARPNTITGNLFISENQYLPRIISATASLIRFPYGCSEQVVSQSYPSIVYKGMWEKYGVEPPDMSVTEGVARAMAYLKTTQHSDGLFGYWPGTAGYVYLTAYVVDFLTEVNTVNKTLEKPFPFDQSMYRSAIEALKRSLRSDYSRFVGGYSAYERSCALMALAKSGHTDIGYTRELAAAANELDVSGKANVFKVVSEKESVLGKQYASLEDQLWKSAIFMDRKGKEVFGGFQKAGVPVGARMHMSDVAALASFVSAMSSSPKTKSNPRTLLLAQELANMGTDDGWGSTYANSLSLLALRDFIDSREKDAEDNSFKLNDGDNKSRVLTMKTATTAYFTNSKAGNVTPDGQTANRVFWVKLSRRYMPQTLGGTAEPEQRGFAVKRDIFKIKKGAAPERVTIDKGGTAITVKSGAILEEHVQIVNPEERLFVAVTVPMAAGFEPLNPRLENASSNAVPTNKTTNGGDYSAFYDDRVVYFFERMKQGTYDFYFRSQAITEGEFSQPPARAEMMYQMNIFGTSAGGMVTVEKP